jgi:glucose uptake protein GlcU
MPKQRECILLALDFFRWFKKILTVITLLLVHIGMDLTSFDSTFQNASSESKKFKFGIWFSQKSQKNEKKMRFSDIVFFRMAPER